MLSRENFGRFEGMGGGLERGGVGNIYDNEETDGNEENGAFHGGLAQNL
jgi:hypothetical protein